MIFNSTYLPMKSTLVIPICWFYSILLHKRQPFNPFICNHYELLTFNTNDLMPLPLSCYKAEAMPSEALTKPSWSSASCLTRLIPHTTPSTWWRGWHSLRIMHKSFAADSLRKETIRYSFAPGKQRIEI